MKLLRRERGDRGATPGQGGFGPGLELNRLRHEIDRLFEEPFSLLAPSTSFFEGWSPAVDIYEDKDKYTVKAELPGIKNEDIDVSLDGYADDLRGAQRGSGKEGGGRLPIGTVFRPLPEERHFANRCASQ